MRNDRTVDYVIFPFGGNLKNQNGFEIILWTPVLLTNLFRNRKTRARAKKTLRDVKLLQLFLVTKNEERNIEDIPTGELNKHTGENTSRLLFEVYFYIPANIINDLVFEKTRKTLQSKQKELKKQGK